MTADTANTYTGCLNEGTLYDVQVGTEPLAASKARELEAIDRRAATFHTNVGRVPSSRGR